VQFANAASDALPPSCAAALAAAQLSAIPVASTLELCQAEAAEAGAAASSMVTPTEIEKQDFKDIRTSADFCVHCCNDLPQEFRGTRELLVCMAACLETHQLIGQVKMLKD
jgi:hypothetical protein